MHILFKYLILELIEAIYSLWTMHTFHLEEIAFKYLHHVVTDCIHEYNVAPDYEKTTIDFHMRKIHERDLRLILYYKNVLEQCKTIQLSQGLFEFKKP